MIPDVKLKISLQELSLRGSRIIAQQSEISFAAALQQVQRLKQISKVKQSAKKRKPTPERILRGAAKSKKGYTLTV